MSGLGEEYVLLLSLRLILMSLTILWEAGESISYHMLTIQNSENLLKRL